MQGGGLEWLFPFQDGHPPVGWADAGAYLVLPVLLVASQYASQKIISASSANSNDPAQQQSQAILKFLPLMIGGCGGGWSVGVMVDWCVARLVCGNGSSCTGSDVGKGEILLHRKSMLAFLLRAGGVQMAYNAVAAFLHMRWTAHGQRLCDGAGGQPSTVGRPRSGLQLPVATLLTCFRPSLALLSRHARLVLPQRALRPHALLVHQQPAFHGAAGGDAGDAAGCRVQGSYTSSKWLPECKPCCPHPW